MPEKPQAMDIVEITATISNENITNAYIIIQECNANTGICFEKENYSMTKTAADSYSATINLANEGATYLQYTLEVQTPDGWNTYNENTKVTYESSPATNGNGDKDGNDTPGLTFSIFVFSIIFIILSLYKRNR
jgi:hypothetical protein